MARTRRRAAAPPCRRAATPPPIALPNIVLPPIASPPALLRNKLAAQVGSQLLLSRLGRDEVEVLLEHLGPFAICALCGAEEFASDEALQGYLHAPTEVPTWVLAQLAPKACLVAAGQGGLDCLRLAVRHGCKFDYSDCLSAAVMAACLDALRWLLRIGFPTGPIGTRSWMRRAMVGAARGGRLRVNPRALQRRRKCGRARRAPRDPAVDAQTRR